MRERPILLRDDEARAEIKRMKTRPAEAEYSRLDAMWQQLVRERDAAVRERDEARAEIQRLREMTKRIERCGYGASCPSCGARVDREAHLSTCPVMRTLRDSQGAQGPVKQDATTASEPCHESRRATASRPRSEQVQYELESML